MDYINFVTDLKLYIVNNELGGASLEGGKRWIAVTQEIQHIQFSSVAQSCPTLCNPMDCSTLGLPVHHQLPEFTQTHVH